MAESPNLVHSDEYKFHNSIDSLSADDQKPQLVQESTTDVKLNLLANPVKITFYDNSSDHEDPQPPNKDNDSPEFTSDESAKSNSSNSSTSPAHKTEQHTPNVPNVPFQPKAMTDGELRYRKIELLRIFQELEEKGIKLSSRYSMSSSLDDMEQEYEILRSIQNKKNGVKLYKNFLTNAVGAIEFMNESYNPFDFQLKGWSEHVSLGIDDYDDVFGELYEKYKNTGQKMQPEMKLMIMIISSATSFHAANTLLKDSPGLGNVVKNNPHFVNNLTKNMVNSNDNPNMKPPPEFVPSENIKGPNPAEFLSRMRERTMSATMPNTTMASATMPPEPLSTRNKIIDSESVSEITSTTKRKGGKKKGININL